MPEVTEQCKTQSQHVFRMLSFVTQPTCISQFLTKKKLYYSTGIKREIRYVIKNDLVGKCNCIGQAVLLQVNRLYLLLVVYN